MRKTAYNRTNFIKRPQESNLNLSVAFVLNGNSFTDAKLKFETICTP